MRFIGCAHIMRTKDEDDGLLCGYSEAEHRTGKRYLGDPFDHDFTPPPVVEPGDAP